MSGKRYPEEFKTEAVKQVVDRGYSVASVATRLDITTHSLYDQANPPTTASFLCAYRDTEHGCKYRAQIRRWHVPAALQ